MTLAERIRRGGYDSPTLEALFTVSQSTVSRLRNGEIGRVRRYALLLDRHEAGLPGETLDHCVDALRSRAEVDPTLREILLNLYRFMQSA